MPLSVSTLAEGFPRATRGEWLALVEKTLKGADFDGLATTVQGGMVIQPLYETSVAPTGFAVAPRGGERAWDIRARVRHPSPTTAHAAILQELAGGAASVIVALDCRGGEGVAVSSAEGLAALLDEVLIDIAPVGLDAGFLGAKAAEWLSDAAKGSPAAPLAFHLDPLSAFARAGQSPGPIESHLIAAAEVTARLAPIHPKASLFLASGGVVHEAGGTAAQELAFALAAALADAKALARAGLPIDQALAAVVLGVSIDGDPLISIAKLRAARLLWTRLTDACGAPARAVVEARSSRRMLTRQDPWTNMVRLTAAGLAGAVGGADAIVLGAFTDAIGLPTAFAGRMARNTQLILMDEGHLGAVADPVAGAGAFEAVTRDLAQSAWAKFNAIEAAGGLVAALRDGLIAAEVEAAQSELKDALAAGSLRIVGVTDYRADELRPTTVDETSPLSPPAPDGRLPGPDSQCPALTAISLEDLAG